MTWIRSFGSYCEAKGHQVVFGLDTSVDVFCSVANLSKIEDLETLKNSNVKILQRLGARYLDYNFDKSIVNHENENIKKLIAYADAVVYQSEFSKTVLYRSLFDGAEPEGDIIYNSTDISLFKTEGERIERPKGKKIILTSAYWGSPQTSIQSIRILAELAKALLYNRNIEFWILGSAYPEDEDLIKGYHLSNIKKLDLKKPIAYEDMPKYLRTADLVLHLKAHEGCSNAVIETMHVGTPLVGLDSGSLPELIEDAALLAKCDGGITAFPCVDMKDLKRKVLKTLKKSEEYKRKMLDRAKYFSQENTYERYLEKLTELCKGR